jgi:glycosyltransferase involved in cell wall biosynthesis
MPPSSDNGALFTVTVIFANRYFYPDQSATSRMVSSLAFALARDGLDVAVLTSRQRHDGDTHGLPASQTIDGVRVFRLNTSRFGRLRLAGRLVDYLTFHLLAAIWLTRHARHDDICIICTDPPLLSVTAALPLAFRRARLVNWLMDLFPEVAIDLGVMRSKSVLARISLGLRDWSLHRAALNACPIGSMARYLESRAIAADTLALQHHWSEASEIRPVPREQNQLRRAWGYDGELVVGYSGNFGRAHDFSTVLDAAERLRDRDDIRFLFIGDGKQRGAVEAEVAKRDLTASVLFKPLQPPDLLAESLSAADVHLVSLLPALERSIIPSKLYGILAAGRPTLFVGDVHGEVASTIAAGHCGLSVSVGEGEKLAAMIADLAAHPEIVASMSANARALFDAGYTREQGVAAWRKLLANLDKRATAPMPARLTRRAHE